MNLSMRTNLRIGSFFIAKNLSNKNRQWLIRQKIQESEIT